MKTLEPYQMRVIAENAELESRLAGLTTFIASVFFDSTSEAEQGRLLRQSNAMIVLGGILRERIAAFQPVEQTA